MMVYKILLMLIIHSHAFMVSLSGFDSDIIKNSPYKNSTKNINVIKSKDGLSYDARNIYQPKYICDMKDPKKAVTHPAWHHSCVASCKETYERNNVGIELMEWKPVGPAIDVYKISMSEVCYTSHENIWGYCSQSQNINPKAPSKEESIKIVENLTKQFKITAVGTNLIKNSKEADCDYFKDVKNCNNDFNIQHKTGKVYRKAESSDVEIMITEDGIRSKLSTEYLQLNDASWVWKMSDHDTSICGWAKSDDISCHYKNTSHLLECPDIGHSFSLDTLDLISTCGGKIYGVNGLVPFRYVNNTKVKSRKEMATPDVLIGESTHVITMVKGVNQALTELEKAHCDSFCDIFTNLYVTGGSDVIQTPLGPWVLSKRDEENVLYPCLMTANWVVTAPMTTCGTTNVVAVNDKTTGQIGIWDMSKEYIISELTCVDSPEIGKERQSLPAKIGDGKQVNLTMYDGSILSFSPPDYFPILIPSLKPKKMKLPDGWAAKMKLKPEMIRQHDNVVEMLTSYVNNTITDYNITKRSTRGTYVLLLDEITGGAGKAVTGVWGYITDFFWEVKKLVFFIGILVVIYVVYLVVRSYKSKNPAILATEALMTANDSLDVTPSIRRRRSSRSRTRTPKGEGMGAENSWLTSDT